MVTCWTDMNSSLDRMGFFATMTAPTYVSLATIYTFLARKDAQESLVMGIISTLVSAGK